jgi:hypothetical protein
VKHAWWAALALTCAVQAQPSTGPAIKRVANMADGAPAFDVIDARGARVSRIECIWNGWYDSDNMAARLLASTQVMAHIIGKAGHLTIEELGPATFDCVVVPMPMLVPKQKTP